MRRLILAVGTLALILLAYGVYMFRQKPSEPPAPKTPEIALSLTSASASQGALVTRGLRVSPGRHAAFEFFDNK
ncbi:unnamed protein product, partial [marine sediment metagenome]